MQQINQKKQKQIELSPGLLLNQQGVLQQAGFAYSLVKQYRRGDIKSFSWRIKEWDYYYIGDNNYAVALTIADLSYSALISVTILDFKQKRQWTKSITEFLTFGSLHLPESSTNGRVEHSGKNFDIKFLNQNGQRKIICKMAQFENDLSFQCDITLTPTNPFSMVIATPFENQRYFYYNQKINLLAADGQFMFGNVKYIFKKGAYGVLDWGRGVWTYSNTWYWASMSGEFQNHRYGFNLGYGFGNTSNATQNMFFFDNEAYKLNDVKFNIPMNNKGVQSYLQNWTFTSQDESIKLQFKPLIDRYANVNFLIIQSVQHQVFGFFSGQIKVNGKKFVFQNILGFAEKVKNRW